MLLPRTAVLPVLLLGVLEAACGPTAGPALTARVSDEWHRTYELGPGGEVDISNSRGAIEVQGTDEANVVVDATRTVTGATDAMAREALPRVILKEAVGPGKVAIVTQGLSGIVVGIDVEVNYRARIPRTANVRLRTRNGAVTVTGFSGNVVVNTTNGPITATGLSGAVELRNTNGVSRVGLASFGSALVDLRATNGPISLTLPASSNATLLATATNGKIDTSGIPFEPIGEQRPRRVRGRLNAGGTPIEINTTNGSITVAAPGARPPEPGPERAR